MRFYLFFFFCILCKGLFAQKLHHQTLGAGGGVYRLQSGVLVSQSIGQRSVNLKGTSGNLSIQQGFQQSLIAQIAPFYTAINYGVNVYPNPFQSDINIQFSDLITDDIYIYLYNMFGVLLFKSVKTGPQNLLNFDFTAFPAGSYVIQVKSKKLSFSSTLIKI